MPAGVQNSQSQWLSVKDFSPGIRHRLNQGLSGPINFSPQPQGVANIVGTYGCEALQGGGLGPLPFSPSLLAAGPQPVAPASTEFSRIAITGFHVGRLPVSWSPPEIGTANQDMQSQLFTATAYYDLTNPRNYVHGIQRLRLFRATPTYDTIRSITDNTTVATNPEVYTPVRFDEYKVTTPATMPVVAFAESRPDAGGVSTNRVFPDPAAPFAIGTAALAADIGDVLVTHQQRLVGFMFAGSGTGVVGATVFQNDDIRWTNPTLLTVQATGFISDGGALFGIFASANASELTLITLQEGAWVIQGDINNPTVTKYSAVQPTNGSWCEPAYVPGLGIVYGSKDAGIWAYGGGQSARLLSPSLPADLWQMSSPTVGWPPNLSMGIAGGTVEQIVPHFGQFTYTNGYLICPQNWVLNVNTGSWWRVSISNGTVLCPWWDVTPQGYLVAATQYSTANTIYGAAPKTPASQWQWTSHPIPIAQDDNWSRVVEFLGLFQSGQIAFANSTVTVILTSYPNQLSKTITFNIGEDGMVKAVRGNLSDTIRGTHCVVQITASGSSSGTAPTMHEFRLNIASDTIPISSTN